MEYFPQLSVPINFLSIKPELRIHFYPPWASINNKFVGVSVMSCLRVIRVKLYIYIYIIRRVPRLKFVRNSILNYYYNLSYARIKYIGYNVLYKYIFMLKEKQTSKFWQELILLYSNVIKIIRISIYLTVRMHLISNKIVTCRIYSHI